MSKWSIFVHKSFLLYITEPCTSGSEINSDGQCEQCEVGTYRTADESYLCVPCPIDTTTATTGAISSANCSLCKHNIYIHS